MPNSAAKRLNTRALYYVIGGNGWLRHKLALQPVTGNMLIIVSQYFLPYEEKSSTVWRRVDKTTFNNFS
jgi:hypothetical protein